MDVEEIAPQMRPPSGLADAGFAGWVRGVKRLEAGLGRVAFHWIQTFTLQPEAAFAIENAFGLQREFDQTRHALAVEPQEVVRCETEATDWWL